MADVFPSLKMLQHDKPAGPKIRIQFNDHSVLNPIPEAPSKNDRYPLSHRSGKAESKASFKQEMLPAIDQLKESTQIFYDPYKQKGLLSVRANKIKGLESGMSKK